MKPVQFTLITIFYLIHINLQAQNHDHVWLFGSGLHFGNPSPPHSDSRLDFNFDPPLVTIDPRYMILTDNCIVTSDFNGNLLFYSSGKSIANANHQTMAYGSGLNPGDYASSVGSMYDLFPQGILTIPVPGDPEKYFILHTPFQLYDDPFAFIAFALLYTTVDMTGFNGNGEVIAKNETIISDSLGVGKLTATKHANGRDWWVLCNEWWTNNYYTVLVTPDGPEVIGVQAVGSLVKDGLGQAVFSPDGTKYAVVNGDIDTYIRIFDFDRCTGLLSNEIFMEYSRTVHNILSPGLAISPNSRFLYFSATDTIYQYDLWAGDIPSSEIVVGEYDGNIDPFPNSFYMAQLAPDGKIYINVPNGSNYLHVINDPDMRGLSSIFQIRGLNLLNRNGYTLPNNPNYRLGPLDGSPCDTLGLNNMPIAKYRYEQPDSNDYLTVAFRDLSYYEPATWHWDFGDNTTSQDTSPVHVFLQDGTYEVCLTVSNVNGENTFCRTLFLGTVGTGEAMPDVEVSIFPNPCREGVNVVVKDYLPKNAKVVLFDALGKWHKAQAIRTGWNTIHLDGLLPGLYFYKIWETCPECPQKDILLKSGKLVKVE